jgi:hypothetical protein
MFYTCCQASVKIKTMETSQNYKGYQIWSYSFGGTTEVGYMGRVIKTFKGLGEMKGEKAAKKYIDAQF